MLFENELTKPKVFSLIDGEMVEVGEVGAYYLKSDIVKRMSMAKSMVTSLTKRAESSESSLAAERKVKSELREELKELREDFRNLQCSLAEQSRTLTEFANQKREEVVKLSSKVAQLKSRINEQYGNHSGPHYQTAPPGGM